MSHKPALLPRRVQTPIGVLPADWEVKQLGENAYIKARIGWRGLSADEYTKDGPLLVAGTHIRGAHIDWMSCDHVSDFRYEESPEIQLQEDDVILSKDGTLGRVGIVERLPGRATINGTMMLVRPKRDTFESKFLYNYLQGRNFRIFVKEKVSGSSVPHIFQRDMVRLLVPSPPLLEQRKIAAILSSVDDTIERAQAVIDQVQVVKRGLMRELLTQGLPGQRKRFKQTDFGEVPETWVETVLGNVLELKRGYDLPRQDRAAGAVPVISSSGVTGTHAEARVEGPGVVTGRYGNIGQVFFVNGDFWPLNTTLYVRDFKGNDPRFISHFLRGLDFSAHSGKTAVPGVNRNHLHRITVVFPPDIAVQRAIAAILSSVDDAINRSRSVIDSIQVVKIALMSVLLTGELRVTPDPEPE